YPSAESANSGVGALVQSANTLTTPVRVAVERGDALISAGRARLPDVVKIDVEGFEYEVLCGLGQHLARRYDLLIVFENEPYRDSRIKVEAAIDLLKSLGVSLLGGAPNGLVRPLQPTMLHEHVDILARGPSDRAENSRVARAPHVSSPRVSDPRTISGCR